MTGRWRLVLGIALILVGVAGLWLTAGGGWAPAPFWREFASNGEQIYYAGVSRRTGRVPFVGGPMWLRMHGGGCVACHGASGRGGIRVARGGAPAPDIRYSRLVEEGHQEHGETGPAPGEAEHPPYTDATLRRAIVEGVDPAGRPLDWAMPRWRLSDADLSDLLAYLKTLE